MKNRIDNLIANLPAESFLVTNNSDIFYLTGLNLEGFWLFLTRGMPVVFAPRLIARQVSELLNNVKVFEGDKIFDLLLNYCKKNKIQELGIDGSKISFNLAQKLQKYFKVKDISGYSATLRQIKDDLEIADIKKSCRIASSAVKYIEKILKPGITEIEVSYKIEEYFAKNMVRPSFLTIVASGPNSANPHHISSSRQIEKNDVVLIDLGCIYNGYCSDLTRTFFLGKIVNLKKQIYNLVEKAQTEAIKKVCSGEKTAAIDKISRNIISKAGYGRRFIHSTGHGVGIQIHESPSLNKNDKTILKAGMVVTVEPGIYLDNQFGVRIEDTILVTQNGSEVLTR